MIVEFSSFGQKKAHLKPRIFALMEKIIFLYHFNTIANKKNQFYANFWTKLTHIPRIFKILFNSVKLVFYV